MVCKERVKTEKKFDVSLTMRNVFPGSLCALGDINKEKHSAALIDLFRHLTFLDYWDPIIQKCTLP